MHWTMTDLMMLDQDVYQVLVEELQREQESA